MRIRQGTSMGKPELFEWDKINNIIIERKNLTFGESEGEIWYYYDQYEYSLDEYIKSRFEQVQSDLDYISMMTEVDL